MSITMDDEIKRWTARRKAALVLEIVQVKTTVAEARPSGLNAPAPPGHIESAERDAHDPFRSQVGD